MATSLLNSPQLPNLIRRNSESLGASYRFLTEGLTRLNIKYIPANYGLFVFTKIAEDCCSAQEEAAAVAQLAQTGLIVAQGQKFTPGGNEWGWARITFSTSTDKIQQALSIMEQFRANAW
jgi:aspartate/methionine/tyrosine aminotransferase